MSLKHDLLTIVVGLSIAGCGSAELSDNEAETAADEAAEASPLSITLTSTCGNTTLIRTSTVRDGKTWISYGELPGGASVNYICGSGVKVYSGYNYVQIQNKSGIGGITYGWVLQRNVR